MNNFRVGMKVVCVDASADIGGGDEWGPTEAPREGRAYTITSIHEWCGHPVVWLAEIVRDANSIEWFGPKCGYGVERFRPAVERKTDISIFTRMLTDDKVDA